MFFYWYDYIYCKIQFYLEYANFQTTFFDKSSFCNIDFAKCTFFAFLFNIIWLYQIFFVPLHRI